MLLPATPAWKYAHGRDGDAEEGEACGFGSGTDNRVQEGIVNRNTRTAVAASSDMEFDCGRPATGGKLA
jgi:hypothetical protein